jgi:ATP-dependent RNA/DNA helicase IGHMBP2
MSRGDYLTVEVERTTHQDVPHQLRFGMPAVFFSNHDPKTDRVEGTISFQGGNRAKITLRTDELPDWSSDGKLGIEVLFDDNSYDEMEEALKTATSLAGETRQSADQYLTGSTSPTFHPETPKLFLPTLNSSQVSAVEK